MALGEEARMTVAVRTDLTGEVGSKEGGGGADRRGGFGDRAGAGGRSREDAARSTGMDRQTCATGCTASTWLGGGLLDRKAAGRQRRLNQDQLDELVGCLGSGTIERDGVVRWRLADLCAWSSAASASATGARHGQAGAGAWLQPDLGPAAAPRSDPEAQAELKKTARADHCRRRREALGKRLEIWFQDEARIGQKGELTRQWARRGTRPRQPRDQRYQAAYLFAAACPEAEKTAALVLPQVNTEAMNLHLARDRAATSPPMPMPSSFSIRPAGTAATP